MIKSTRNLIMALVLPLALFAAPEAQAAGLTCGDRTKLIKALSEKYQESPMALGLSATGKAMFEIYTSDTGTWTILMTNTSGVTCIMAAGHSWETIPDLAEGEPT
ncbi:hypothetical protein [Hoeflea sp. TYP-13]|uniref:hypothetical protein n=1 Tax=Hoeflea sp. TYP-13 TaxID=3230023 RepID=UPI0034C5D6A2